MSMKNTFLTEQPIAHRGLHGETVPENSLASFQKAIEKGYAIETDVRLTKDGALVLFHDDSLSRMCGVEKEVHDCTSEQLSHLRLADTDEKIPLLGELLALNGGRVPILLEIKEVKSANKKEYLQKIYEAFKGYDGEYAVQSFHPALVKGYRKLCPEIPCGILATAQSKRSDFNGSKIWKFKAFAVKNMLFNGWIKPTFLSYHAPDLPRKKTEKFKGTVLAWTVRSKEEQAALSPYADNIIFEGFLPE